MFNQEWSGKVCRNACAEWKGFDRAIGSSRQPFHAPTLPLPAPVSHTHLAAVAVHVPQHALESHIGRLWSLALHGRCSIAG